MFKTTILTAVICTLTSAGASDARMLKARPTAGTPAAVYSRCTASGDLADQTAECVSFRQKVQAELRDCMATSGTNATSYKAHALICDARVRQIFGTSGH